MKKFSLLSLFLYLIVNGMAQQISNVVFVGNNGVTENIKEAHSFIVVKKYPDSYKRLDYKFNAPLVKERNYTDSSLSVLEGKYYEYAVDGSISKSGQYHNNLKEDEWYFYNDTGKVILEEQYDKGILKATINPDTVKDHASKTVTLQPGEKEATFKDGNKDWIKYLVRNLKADVAQLSTNGGQVTVQFVVNKEGKCIDIHLFKSVEYALDEETRRIIENSPAWQPAVQDGRKVNAYRRQPITFKKE